MITYESSLKEDVEDIIDAYHDNQIIKSVLS